MEITDDLQYNFIKMITIKTIQAHVKKDLLETAINEEYCRLAEKPDSGFHFVTGWKLAEIVNYDFRLLKELPEGAVARFAGVGNPFAMGKPLPGQTVLDIGSGAGMDALLAAKMVGYEGFVYGIDLTPEMVELAQQHADNQGADNLAFIHASAESIPLADNSIDMVISNGVINLCHDKERVFSEIVRVLKPGGTLLITTPNIMSIKSRTRFLFYGYHDFFRFIKLPRGFRHGHPEYDHQHINPMTFTELRYALEKAGLEVTGVHTNRYVTARRWGFLYPLVRHMIVRNTKGKAPDDRDLYSREILEGEILVVEGRRS